MKKAKECGVLLDREFYHEALVQLRVWGQDQDALSAVYKAMRKLDQFGESMVEQQSVTNLTTATTPATDEHISSSESCVELSEPPSPPAVAVCGPADVASTPSMSLERALQGSGSQNYSSLLQLLEVGRVTYRIEAPPIMLESTSYWSAGKHFLLEWRLLCNG